MMTKYSHGLGRLINKRIPNSILEVMRREGWNALGIYELVKRERAKERRKIERRKDANTS